MPNAKDYLPKDHGILSMAAGPPKTGKSSLIISLTNVGPTAVAITDPAELDLYGGHDIEYELFTDEGWRPNAKAFGATDFVKLLAWIDETSQRNDIRCIGIDHMSGGTTSPGVSELAMHEALKIHKVGNPLDLAHGQAYMGHANNMRDFLNALRVATSRGKHVVVASLVQLRESETSTTDKEVLLPAVHGSIRQHIAASFSVVFYTYMIGEGLGVKYYVRTVPSSKEPAGSRLKFKEPKQMVQMPNDFAQVLAALA
jgi:hypothetical protein